MVLPVLPPLPGVDPDSAPSPDDPGWGEWVERVTFTADGVDRSLIWQMLHRTPAERLLFIEALSREMEAMRRGFAASRRD